MGSSTRVGKLSSRDFQRCREEARDERPVDRAEQNVEKREGKKKDLSVPGHTQVGLVLRSRWFRVYFPVAFPLDSPPHMCHAKITLENNGGKRPASRHSLIILPP